MKKVLRNSLFLLSACILVFSLFQLLLAYPNLLFKQKASYKNYFILSDMPIEAGVKNRLDSISLRLENTGFLNKRTIKIIFCYNDQLANFLNKISLAPTGAGFNHFSGSIYIFSSRIARFRAENSKAAGEHKELIEYTYQSFDLDRILTHEILHKLHSDSMGFWAYKRKLPPPNWKAEGFAEYYTFIQEKRKDKNYDFRNRVGLFLKYRDQFPLFYYKSQLLYEFLTVYQELDFNAIMQQEITELKAFDQLTAWYTRNTPS